MAGFGDIVIDSCLRRVLRKRDKSDKPLRYLEVGVHQGDTFQGVSSKIDGVEVIKEGVDPYCPFSGPELHRMTSQLFFALNEAFWKNTYDVIFLDALHFSLVLNQEIDASLKILNEHGIIVLDDTVPPAEDSGSVTAESIAGFQKHVSYPLFHDYDPTSPEHYKYFQEFPGFPHANGDCWKSVARLRMTHPDLKIGTIMHPRGATLITQAQTMEERQVSLPLIPDDDIDWAYFLKHRHDILQFTNLGTFLT